MSPKASFDEQYRLYSPQSYVQFFLKDLDYRLPFEAMTLLGNYLESIGNDEVLETAIIGSCHGIDSAVLKYRYTYDDILQYWLYNNPEHHLFQGGDPHYRITMVDINEEPLRFAKDVGLCHNYYRCNMKEALPDELRSYLEQNVDLLISVGIVTYLGLQDFQKLVKLVERSNVKYFCFSLPSFIRNSYIKIFESSGLKIKILGDINQRKYKDEGERNRVIAALKEQEAYSTRDDDILVASICVAYKT